MGRTLPALNSLAQFGIYAAADGVRFLEIAAFEPGAGFRRRIVHPGRTFDLTMELIAAPLEARRQFGTYDLADAVALLAAGVVVLSDPAAGAGAAIAGPPVVHRADVADRDINPGLGIARFLSPGVSAVEAFDPPPPERRSAEVFANDGLMALQDLLRADLCGAVEHYYSRLAVLRLMVQARRQVDRQVIFNDPVARVLQRALLPVVADVVGAPIKPSYTLACRYADGAVLPMHTDRSACEYTLSLQLGPEPGRDGTPWPFHIADRAGGVRDLRMPRGSGVLFRGRELAHGRPCLAPGALGATLLLHYVDIAFEGPAEDAAA